jgi:hypothetical protein
MGLNDCSFLVYDIIKTDIYIYICVCVCVCLCVCVCVCVYQISEKFPASIPRVVQEYLINIIICSTLWKAFTIYTWNKPCSCYIVLLYSVVTICGIHNLLLLSLLLLTIIECSPLTFSCFRGTVFRWQRTLTTATHSL